MKPAVDLSGGGNAVTFWHRRNMINGKGKEKE
jgi:hypothetical protein